MFGYIKNKIVKNKQCIFKICMIKKLKTIEF